MIKRILRRAVRLVADVLETVSSKVGALSTLVRLGPRAFAAHRRSLRGLRAPRGATFANGVTTSLTPARAEYWRRANWTPTVVVVSGTPRGDLARWMTETHRALRVHFLLAAETAAVLARVPSGVDVAGRGGAPEIELTAILDWMHRDHRRWDLVLINADDGLLTVPAMSQLQHAAHDYHRDHEIGFVTPAYSSAAGDASGYEIDRRTGDVRPRWVGAADQGSGAIPRYVLTAAAHGFYATSAAIDRVDIAGRHLRGRDLDAQVAILVRHGWAGNLRTLCLSSTLVEVRRVPELELAEESRRWVLHREVTGDDGRTRVIFVLNATSISGGIRIVFELANGLADRGFDVEIWSLQEHPAWFDLRVRVATYRSYDDLLLSLRNEDAIKVATWWETADIVWLASANHGVPAYLVQEFETWFYPDDPVARAAVIASYRREMIAVTEATYQQGELAEVGLTATLIRNGYDPSVFRELPGWPREENTVIALGRSFFQKNFAMTVRAWNALGDRKPNLLLFGTEPDILVAEGVEYVERPSDAEVNELYNSAAAFVQTSRHEGFCLPILEAMAAGTPVVTTDSHGNRDFCVDGENCVMVPQDDHQALARAIRSLLDDPDERERLRRAGVETARRYQWPIVLDEVAAFYAAIAAASSAGEPFADATVERSER